MSLAERLRAALARADAIELLAGDHDELAALASVTPAAVLVPVTDRPEPGVLLTRRTDTLRKHPGQIAFPGGRRDPGEDAVAAALREADEEIGLPAHAVEVAGTADRYRTVTGYEVTPVVGVIAPDLPLRPNAAEVAAVFEAPLAFLLDHANHAKGSATWRGQVRHFYEIRWEEHRIWGATAAMIVNLARRLAWS